MQTIQSYGDWSIVINRTNGTTVVHGYGEEIPVKQFTADTIEEVKRMIDKYEYDEEQSELLEKQTANI